MNSDDRGRLDCFLDNSPFLSSEEMFSDTLIRLRSSRFPDIKDFEG
jgi:hypothetical protein